MKKLTKKSMISLILVLTMIFNIVPFGAFTSKVQAAGEVVTNLQWNGNTVEWDAYPGATQYRIILDKMEGITPIGLANNDITETSKDYSEYLLPGNTYRVSVLPMFGSDTYGHIKYNIICKME